MATPHPVVTLPSRTTASNRQSLGDNSRLLLLALGLLLLGCYARVLYEMGIQIGSSEDIIQAYLAPAIAAIIVWERRQWLFVRDDRPTYWGVPVALVGFVMTVLGIAGASSTLARIGFFVSGIGCILAVGGRTALRKMAYPITVLLFTVPLPSLLYDELTMPLRLLATQLAELMLELLGYTVIRQGNVLELAHIQLSVVDACSGLRALVALTLFGVAYGYFLERSLLRRVLLALSAIPVAILVNAMRVTATGVLSQYDSRFTHGAFHDSLGWAALLTGFAGLALARLVIQKVLGFQPNA